MRPKNPHASEELACVRRTRMRPKNSHASEGPCAIASGSSDACGFFGRIRNLRTQAGYDPAGGDQTELQLALKDLCYRLIP
jgi:hypothetical protein